MKRVYRIVTEMERRAINQNGCLLPSKLDTESGFIHLSSIDHVLTTANLYFAEGQSIYLLEIDAGKLGSHLRYERVAARNNHRFPHYYGDLIMESAILRIIAFGYEDGVGFTIDI